MGRCGWEVPAVCGGRYARHRPATDTCFEWFRTLHGHGKRWGHASARAVLPSPGCAPSMACLRQEGCRRGGVENLCRSAGGGLVVGRRSGGEVPRPT